MSTTYSTYVGPYARCAVERVPVTRMQITCPTEGCKNHGEGMRRPFCDLCGAKVASLPYIEMDFAIDHWDVSEEIDEALCNPGGDEYHRWTEANAAHLWIPNRSMPGRDPRLEEREAFALFEIEEKQLAAEILQFQVTFEDALAQVRERYGNLTLHWGIIQDYS
jgi:hypothetical protein